MLIFYSIYCLIPNIQKAVKKRSIFNDIGEVRTNVDNVNITLYGKLEVDPKTLSSFFEFTKYLTTILISQLIELKVKYKIP